ncbi:MAG: HAD family hydrolase [Lachnospiraceae bacterium]|nr:HAD family hydrolase [Lachnospiraceae bacterium]
MERVIFLDRDGTLNEEVNYLYRKEDLRILEGVPGAIRKLKARGFKIVVVTNQAGVARGYYKEEDVKKLHSYMNELLAASQGAIDHFFYCPHHPYHGIGAYKCRCHCRKPETGLLEMAEQYYNVDKERSWMVGDKWTDIQAGIRYGVRTALVGTGYGAEVHREQMLPMEGHRKEGGLPYDIYAETFADAAREILRRDTTDQGAGKP